MKTGALGNDMETKRANTRKREKKGNPTVEPSSRNYYYFYYCYYYDVDDNCYWFLQHCGNQNLKYLRSLRGSAQAVKTNINNLSKL